MEVTIVRNCFAGFLSPVKYEIHVDGDYFKAKERCAQEFPFASTLWGARRLAKQIAKRPVNRREQVVVDRMTVI